MGFIFILKAAWYYNNNKSILTVNFRTETGFEREGFLMNQRSKLIMAGLSFVLLAGFNLGGSRAMSITKNDDPYILKERPQMNLFNMNDCFAVHLKENVSTGYSWHYTISGPAVVKCVAIISKNENQTAFHRVGVPSERIWKFQGIGAGKSEIEFKYYRSWEGEKSAIESHIYDVMLQK
ncbi:MAG TPA: hypothetical protein DDW65_04620 [Firmicutes bacterium]|jgi:predicted secreted protein|nr:hypothetical protein [Bacillota bacterium]